MSYEPHYIASYEQDSGLNTYFEPFLIPEKAFPILEDAVCFRGKVQRRRGYALLGRLHRSLTAKSIGNISAAGAGTVVINIFTALGIAATEIHAQLVPGTFEPFSITIGAPISQTLTDTLGTGVLNIAPGGLITAATINYATGDLTLTFSGIAAASAATITAWYYPALPVMGLRQRELIGVDKEQLIAFDQKYAYQFNSTTFAFEDLPSTTPTTWNGTDSDFFWSTNYYKDALNKSLFWVTNTHMTGATRDPVRYYNGTTWTNFSPLVTAVDTLYNAEVIIAYKGRLLFINTWEGPTVGTISAAINFGQRIRWSQYGTPLAVDAFRSDVVGKGGYVDAPTSEVIVSAEFIKDTLLIKFERSSWKLVYTGNEVLPFVFQKINTELGSESKFSLVPFDKGVFAVSNYGITTDDSVNVERIDLQIPKLIFNIDSDFQGVQRVHGIRDFWTEWVYWTFPDSTHNPTFPNKLLVYNYRNNTYSIFNDSFTTLGYFQGTTDKTWAQLTNVTWRTWTDPWESGELQSYFQQVVGGNQHGFVEVLNQIGVNHQSLYIESINFAVDPPVFTVPECNLYNDDIISIQEIIGSGAPDASVLDGLRYKVSVPDGNNPDEITLQYYDRTTKTFYDLMDPNFGIVGPGSIYLGNGEIAKFNNINITTKIFAPYYESGKQVRLGYVDYLFDSTDDGEVTADVYINECNSLSMTDVDTNTALLGSRIVLTRPENLTLLPLQANQKKIWHRQFIQTISENFQVSITMSDVQNADLQIGNSNIVLHAMAFYLSPNARLTP